MAARTLVNVVQRSHYLLTFSAASKSALQSIVQKHEEYLHQYPENLVDLSYTLNLRREALAHRAYSVVQTGQETEPLRPSPYERVTSGPPSIDMVFTGQGAQYAAMGVSLMMSNATFLRSIENMENVLAQCAKPPVWSLRGTCIQCQLKSAR
jgi:acyl transferase domain-containing protein